MLLGMLLFAQISGNCAAGNSTATLASVAKAESGLDTLAIHDNTSGVSLHPANEEQARDLATNLIVGRGHSVDLGLMQINSANLPRLGLSIADAFDACHAISAGARILRDYYQQALREAFSRYNTGDRLRGFANGYVHRVELAGAALPALDAGRGDVERKPPVASVPAMRLIVVDMLHTNQVAVEPPSGPDNLLSGVAPSRTAETSSQMTAAVPHPTT